MYTGSSGGISMALPKIKIWDVFEIETAKGMAYFQCVKESSAIELEIIRILKGILKH